MGRAERVMVVCFLGREGDGDEDGDGDLRPEGEAWTPGGLVDGQRLSKRMDAHEALELVQGRTVVKRRCRSGFAVRASRRWSASEVWNFLSAASITWRLNQREGEIKTAGAVEASEECAGLLRPVVEERGADRSRRGVRRGEVEGIVLSVVRHPGGMPPRRLQDPRYCRPCRRRWLRS